MDSYQKICRIRGPTYTIRDFWIFAQKSAILETMADFSKIYLNEVWKTVLTDLEPQYTAFIQKRKFESKKHFLAIFS